MPNSAPKESAKFWKHPALPTVELLRATYVTHSFARHLHDGYALGVIEWGREAFQYRGSSHVAPAGSIAIIHPGEVHTGHAAAAEGWRYRMFYPDAAVLAQVAAQVAGREMPLPYFPDPVIADAQIAQGLRQVHRALENGDSRLACESRFLWFLAQLVARHGCDRPIPTPLCPDPGKMQRVREYLEAHLADAVALEELADLVQMSSFQVLRAFRHQFGLPPHAYLTHLRLLRAKHLLAQQEAIAQVAADTGFSDQSHLNRHFKRVFGIPPGLYQRGYQLHGSDPCKNVQDLPAPLALG